MGSVGEACVQGNGKVNLMVRDVASQYFIVFADPPGAPLSLTASRDGRRLLGKDGSWTDLVTARLYL